MSARHLLALPCVLALPLAVARAADTLLVPQQFPTIQAAVDASAEFDTIQVKGGTYLENVVITAKKGLTLRGKGKVVIDADGADAGLALVNCLGCTVEKLQVRNADGGLSLSGCDDTTLSRCRVDECAIGIFLANSPATTIEQCTLVMSAGTAIAFSGGSPSNGCLLLHNKLLGDLGDGVDLAGSELSLVGNLITGGSAGISLSGAAGPGIVLTGNRIQQVDFGLLLNGDGVVCTDNRIVGSALSGISIFTGAGDFVSGNKLAVSAGMGINAGGGPANLVISGNSVSGAADDEIFVGCDGFVLDSNQVKGGGDGILITGNSGNCIGNTVKGAVTNGLELQGDSNLLSGNTVKGSGQANLANNGLFNQIDDTNKF